MAATPTLQGLMAMRHKDVHDTAGEKVGELVEVYVDKATREPEWLGVDAGLFGMKRVLVPAAGSRIEPGAVRVAFTKDLVLHTPDVMDEQVSQDVEQQLYDHYGLRYSFDRSPTGLPETETAGEALGGEQDDRRAAAARWPDVPERIDERPVFAPDRAHALTRHDLDRRSTFTRFRRTARTTPETPWFAAAIAAFVASLVAMRLHWQRRVVDLRIAGLLLLIMSVAEKRRRAMDAERLEQMDHPTEQRSLGERMKRAIGRA
jgi:hypothetical protein